MEDQPPWTVEVGQMFGKPICWLPANTQREVRGWLKALWPVILIGVLLPVSVYYPDWTKDFLLIVFAYVLILALSAATAFVSLVRKRWITKVWHCVVFDQGVAFGRKESKQLRWNEIASIDHEYVDVRRLNDSVSRNNLVIKSKDGRTFDIEYAESEIMVERIAQEIASRTGLAVGRSEEWYLDHPNGKKKSDA